MEPRGSSVSPLRMRRRITTSAPEQDHSRSGASIGRAECREKKIGIEPKGSFFFLTSPLIGHVTRGCPKMRLRIVQFGGLSKMTLSSLQAQATRVNLSGFSPSNCTENTKRKPTCQTCQLRTP